MKQDDVKINIIFFSNYIMARNLSLEELLIYITNKHSINVDWFKAMRKYNFLGKFVIVLFLQWHLLKVR